MLLAAGQLLARLPVPQRNACAREAKASVQQPVCRESATNAYTRGGVKIFLQKHDEEAKRHLVVVLPRRAGGRRVLRGQLRERDDANEIRNKVAQRDHGRFGYFAKGIEERYEVICRCHQADKALRCVSNFGGLQW